MYVRTPQQIKAVDMPDNLQNAAIEIARASVEEHSLEVCCSAVPVNFGLCDADGVPLVARVS